MADPIQIIDREVRNLWREYRTSKDPAALALLDQIDVLLEQRHDLAASQGELIDPADVAAAFEWGPGSPT